jgi:AcrR family transcriptional regulator
MSKRLKARGTANKSGSEAGGRPITRDSRLRRAPPTRAEKSAKTRARILAAASQMFADRGFASVTTRQIAAAADVAFPVMYRHFGDKRKLYLTAFGDSLEHVNRKYVSLLQPAGPADRRLLAFVSELYKDLMSDPFVSKFMQREILDRDYEGLEEMTKKSFSEPYLLVRALCSRLVEEDAAERSAILVYAVTMGLSQFRPIGMTISPGSTRWTHPDSMARLILALVFPARDWSRASRIGAPPRK